MRVRPYQASDGPASRAILKQAFADDPIMHIIFPGKMYDLLGERFFGMVAWMLHRSFGMSEVVETEDGTVCAVALWQPAQTTWGAQARQIILLAWMVWRIGLKGMSKLWPLMMATERKRFHHAPTADYLQCIGVDPSFQGQGIGSLLLTVGLERAQASGVPSYLESSQPRNIPFYRRHGFTILEEYRPYATESHKADGNPIIALMGRSTDH